MTLQDITKMSRDELVAALMATNAAKQKLSAVVDPLRAERDATIAAMHPLQTKANDLAEKIKGHMPAMAEIDQRLSAIAKALGHARVGGLPTPFAR